MALRCAQGVFPFTTSGFVLQNIVVQRSQIYGLFFILQIFSRFFCLNALNFGFVVALCLRNIAKNGCLSFMIVESPKNAMSRTFFQKSLWLLMPYNPINLQSKQTTGGAKDGWHCPLFLWMELCVD